MSGGVGDGQAGECSTLPMHGSALIELSHDLSSGGYMYDLVTLGQAVMECDSFGGGGGAALGWGGGGDWL